MADKKNLPTTDALKERFKAGSIPLQSDFSDLIDMADAGASAVGLAAGQPGPTGLGMRLSPDGRLELNVSGSYNFSSDTDIETTTPVTIDTSNNRPVVDLGYGLKGSSVGLSVRASTGIVANGDGVSVDAGIIANADAGAKAVGKYTGQDGKPGLGMRLTSDGKLELNIDKKDFDYSSEEDGSVFIAVDKGTNKPVLDLGKGLTRGGSEVEVSVKASTGIKVDANGVGVDMAYVVPRGVIVSFWGDTAPEGWAFCDGTNGTPDLRHRFIKGSEDYSRYTGGSGSNTFTPSGSITVDSHTLTINEIPSHSHNFVKRSSNNYGPGYFTPLGEQGSIIDMTTAYWEQWLGKTGGDGGHNHTGSFHGSSLTIDNEPQYYAIAYIMKL
ncbi:hypothetical protein [Kosakonia cowanii]|uniref:hypothetical protein n=1 Tax=Kosakonia cowanii TaxID=208223 RepID=UPI0028AC1D5B|nr:hypothetical protein [Kosakonia cowanii]